RDVLAGPQVEEVDALDLATVERAHPRAGEAHPLARRADHLEDERVGEHPADVAGLDLTPPRRGFAAANTIPVREELARRRVSHLTCRPCRREPAPHPGADILE